MARLVGTETRTVFNEISVRNMSLINQITVRNQELSICNRTVRIRSRKYTANRCKRYVFLRPPNGPERNIIATDLGSCI